MNTYDMEAFRSAAPLRWYQVWWQAWRHPRTDVFKKILSGQDPGWYQAYMWIGLTVLAISIIKAPFGSFNWSAALNLILTPIAYMIGLALASGIWHFTARLYEGQGDVHRLAYCLAIIEAPVLLIYPALSVLLSPIILLFPKGSAAGSNDLFGLGLLLFGVLTAGLAIYSCWLAVCAIRSVEQIGTKDSLKVFFFPIAVFSILGVVLYIILSGNH